MEAQLKTLTAEGIATAPRPQIIGALAGDRVPWVDEPECVGCNLCSLVCPVEGCISMVRVDTGRPPLTWKEYQKDPDANKHLLAPNAH